MSQVTPNEDSNQLLLTDQAQSVLTMGYQPRIIKRAIDIILHNEGKNRQPGLWLCRLLEQTESCPTFLIKPMFKKDVF